MLACAQDLDTRLQIVVVAPLRSRLAVADKLSLVTMRLLAILVDLTAVLLLLLLLLPKGRLLVVALQQANEVKGVDEGQEEVAVFLVARAGNLRLAVLGQVGLGRLGQVAARVADVDEPGVDEHERRLKDIKEPLVTQDGTEHVGVDAVDKVQSVHTEILDDTVDGTGEEQTRANVERRQGAGEVLVVYVALEGAAVVDDGQQQKQADNHELQDERGLQEGMAHVLLALGQRGVGAVGGTVGIESLDNGRDGSERGQDAARVDGREMGHIIENAAQNNIVGELKDGRRGIDENGLGNVDVDISVVEGADLAEDVADREQGVAKDVETGQAPALVMDALPDVEEQRSAKKHGEKDGCALIGGINVDAAVDCGVLATKKEKRGVESVLMCMLSTIPYRIFRLP